MSDRHDRTRRHLGSEAHERLRRARVTVVGAGAIGNEIAKNLALLGVGRLDLVDFDRVAPSNLNRCAFFTRDDAAAGVPKVDALARELGRFAPDVRIETHPCAIEEAPESVWECDAFAIGVDDNAARYQINVGVLGRDRGAGIVDAALGRTFCQVQTLSPPATACLVCLWSAEYAERLFAEVLREACDDFFERNVESFPALGVLSSIAGALAATRILGLLAGPEIAFAAPVGHAIRFDLARMESSEGEVVRNPHCVEILCRRRKAPCES
jgi:molybdopterin/thiamine biosynthesis adenylyltransferase